MSRFFYETLGRAAWFGVKHSTRRKVGENAAKIGAGAALVVGVVAVGAVLARSQAPAE